MRVADVAFSVCMCDSPDWEDKRGNRAWSSQPLHPPSELHSRDQHFSPCPRVHRSFLSLSRLCSFVAFFSPEYISAQSVLCKYMLRSDYILIVWSAERCLLNQRLTAYQIILASKQNFFFSFWSWVELCHSNAALSPSSPVPNLSVSLAAVGDLKLA